MESHVDRVAIKMCTDARHTTMVVALPTMPRSVTTQQSHFGATRMDGTLRAAGCVARLAKGIAIRLISRFAFHPAKSPSRPRGTSSEVP